MSGRTRAGTFARGNKAGVATRFRPGNKAALGNPYSKKVAQFRAALYDAVSPADIKQVVRALVEAAVAGDVPAAKLLLDYTLGPATAFDEAGEAVSPVKVIIVEAQPPAGRTPPALPE